MNNLQITEVKGQRVITSKQLAQMYDTEEIRIRQNYSSNKSRYLEGKHYIAVTGNELRALKREVGNSYVVAKNINVLYLWTEKGLYFTLKALTPIKRGKYMIGRRT